MPKILFRRGDHVEWNSEAGRVRGVIIKKVVSNILIQSDKTDHVAIHKGKALRHIRAKANKKSKKQK